MCQHSYANTFFVLFFFFSTSDALRDLPSFPTRRSSDLVPSGQVGLLRHAAAGGHEQLNGGIGEVLADLVVRPIPPVKPVDRKSTRLNSSHTVISYAVFCLKKKK